MGYPVKLSEKDEIVHNMEINYGLKDRQGVAINPVDSCYFFEDWISNEKFHIDKEEVSGMISGSLVSLSSAPSAFRLAHC